VLKPRDRSAHRDENLTLVFEFVKDPHASPVEDCKPRTSRIAWILHNFDEPPVAEV
jgi:hypothetical protein